MQLPRQHIEAVTSNEESRYTLRGVLFDAAKGLLVATDGHALAAIPAKACPGDRTTLIPSRAWKMARDAARRIPRKMRDKLKTTFQLRRRVIVRGNNEMSAFPRMAGQFPKWENLPKDFKPTMAVALNVDILAKLSAALCNPDFPPIVTLFIESPTAIMGVYSEYGEGIGLLMPVRGNNKDFHQRWREMVGTK